MDPAVEHGRPEHSCPGGHEPSPKCPGCVYTINRFGELFFEFLDQMDEGQTSDIADDEFPPSLHELAELGLGPTVWLHCAAIITQLSKAPVTVDRTEQSLVELIATDPQFAVPVLGLIDKILTCTGVGDTASAAAACETLINDHGGKGEWVAHLLLSYMTYRQIRTELSLWQQIVHRTLYMDVPGGIAYPDEMLLAARASGTMLDGDEDGFHMLLNRSIREQTAHILLRFWNHASAQHHGCIAFSIVRTRDGQLDALLNPDADLDETLHPIEQAFVIAARMVKAIAAEDDTLIDKVKTDLEKNRSLVRHVLQAACYFHSQVMHALFAEEVAGHMAGCEHHSRHARIVNSCNDGFVRPGAAY